MQNLFDVNRVKISFHLCNVSVVLMICVKLHVSAAFILWIQVVQFVRQSSRVNGGWSFEGTYCLHIQEWRSLIKMTKMEDRWKCFTCLLCLALLGLVYP